MDTLGLSPAMRGGGSIASSAMQLPTQQLIAAMSAAPPADHTTRINDLILRLILAGTFQKMDLLYVINHDAQSTGLNWVAPSSFALTAVNAPAFVAYRQYTSNATTSYLRTGFIPSTHAVRYTSSAGHISAWVRTNGSTTGTSIGAPNDFVRTRNSTANLAGRVGTATSSTSSATVAVAGLSMINRIDASNVDFYQNAVKVGTTIASVSTALSTIELYLLAGNSAGSPATFSSKQHSIWTVGAALTANEITATYAAFNTYMTDIGAA